MSGVRTAVVTSFLAVLASGCWSGTRAGPFVYNATIRGHHLVVERCWVELSDDELSKGSCHTQSYRLPVTVDEDPPDPVDKPESRHPSPGPP